MAGSATSHVGASKTNGWSGGTRCLQGPGGCQTVTDLAPVLQNKSFIYDKV